MAEQTMNNPQDHEYIMDKRLKAAVDVALDLGMPLLVTGEPGTGKTKLAKYIADVMLEDAKLEVFNTKTTARARDLFYKYNALTHFRDAQREKPNGAETSIEAINPMDYITFEALGKAIIHSSKQRFVVLVDEIDKAPRDFPNDVLFEFEHLAFKIEEASGAEIQNWAKKEDVPIQLDDQGFVAFDQTSQHRPVLVLTSNSEKNLPDAFLRRCIYYHIPFPDDDRLIEIVEKNVQMSEGFKENMLQHAIDHFIEIREKGLRKKPATAELLSWVHLLQKQGINVKDGLEGTDEEIKEKILQTYTVLTKNKEDRQRLMEDLGVEE